MPINISCLTHVPCTDTASLQPSTKKSCVGRPVNKARISLPTSVRMLALLNSSRHLMNN